MHYFYILPNEVDSKCIYRIIWKFSKKQLNWNYRKFYQNLNWANISFFGQIFSPNFVQIDVRHESGNYLMVEFPRGWKRFSLILKELKNLYRKKKKFPRGSETTGNELNRFRDATPCRWPKFQLQETNSYVPILHKQAFQNTGKHWKLDQRSKIIIKWIRSNGEKGWQYQPASFKLRPFI